MSFFVRDGCVSAGELREDLETCVTGLTSASL
jgi:hypothetical protein